MHKPEGARSLTRSWASSQMREIPEVPAQHQFVSAGCRAHNNAHKPPKTVAPIRITILA